MHPRRNLPASAIALDTWRTISYSRTVLGGAECHLVIEDVLLLVTWVFFFFFADAIDSLGTLW